MTIETWFIGSEVVYHGPTLPYRGSNSRPAGGTAYAFYDPETGEVWGKRMVLDHTTGWIYAPGVCPEIRLPYEIEQLYLPDSFFSFLVDYLASRQPLTLHNGSGIVSE